MLFHLLQSTPVEVEKFSADTLVAKGTQIVETIRTTPADQLLQGTLSSVAKFGLKVLLALAIYVVGAWLIRKTKNIIAKAFEKKTHNKRSVQGNKNGVTVVVSTLKGCPRVKKESASRRDPCQEGERRQGGKASAKPETL